MGERRVRRRGKLEDIEDMHNMHMRAEERSVDGTRGGNVDY